MMVDSSVLVHSNRGTGGDACLFDLRYIARMISRMRNELRRDCARTRPSGANTRQAYMTQFKSGIRQSSSHGSTFTLP